QVFWNVEDIIDVNTRLRDLLTKRQKAHAIVETIGDIFLELIPHFGPFVEYSKHQLYSKHEFEKEKASNPAFSSFAETVERLPASRKLELNGYLTKPTTRLARYPLLLEVVLKHTPGDNPDRVAIPKAVKIVRELLGKVNEERRKAENRFDLSRLDKRLVFRPGEEMDLKLKDERRQLVYKGPLNRRGRAAGENGDLQVFLFDHVLLMVRSKVVDKHEQLKVFRRLIPLELLVVSAPEDRTLMRRDSYGSDVGNGKLAAPAPRRDGYQFTAHPLTHIYFYIPAESRSIQFLETKLCVACTKDSEIVDLETLGTQSLLDPADASLDFAHGREGVRPLSIYRIGQEFLLCYTGFAFYVGTSGRRSKRDVTIYWEGTPTAFALHHPCAMAFDPTFIEFRHVEDGSLAQVIRGSNLRCLFADTPPSVNNLPKYHQHTSSTSMRKFLEQSIHSSRLPLQRHRRDEIIFVSDSEVMAVRPAMPPPAQCTSDASAPRV
ncbi:RHO1 GDP-GTP exchange protein 2, partial [Ceratobasidium sp. 428]